MNRRSRLILLVAAALLFSPLGSHAAEKGWFGFALAIDADGILNPKLRSIKIDKIFPASPAAKGNSGSGKSTLAAWLAHHTHADLLDLDTVAWAPNSSLSAHTACFNSYSGLRQELRLLPRLEPPSGELLSWIAS